MKRRDTLLFAFAAASYVAWLCQSAAVRAFWITSRRLVLKLLGA